MRIRILHAFFYPSRDAVSQILSDLAFHLAEQGNAVEAIATSGSYTGDQPRLPRDETVSGVRIRRTWSPNLGKGLLLRRLADNLAYVSASTLKSLTAKRADRLMVLTSPPMFPVVGTVLNAARREPYIYVTMDLYPDIAIQAGVLPAKGPITRCLKAMTRISLCRASRVVVLGQCMAERIRAYGVPAKRIRIVPNWADGEHIRPVSADSNPLRRQLGLSGKFIVMYSGNMGVAHRFDDILHAAKALSARDDIVFLFVGGGVRRAEVERFRDEHELGNILVMDYFPREQLSLSLPLGDAHFVSLREGFEGLIVPSKAYGIMAAGRPMIYQGAADGEIARMLREEGGGVVLVEGHADGLTELIASWADSTDEHRRIGCQARSVFDNSYTKAHGLRRYSEVLLKGPSSFLRMRCS